jgi:hypothetical protein
MRLDELTGVRQYKGRTLYDWLRDFRAAGGWDSSGRYGTVVGHPKWNFVYKFFPHDECYLDFVKWAMENPDPALPKFLTKPKLVTPFYSRPRSSEQVWIIKMERLLPIVTMPVNNIERHIMGCQDIYDIVGDPKQEELYLSGRDHRTYIEGLAQYRNAWARHPKLRDLCAFFWDSMVHAPIPCSFDLHKDNIMMRRDGTYVFTDPYWYGETPLQVHDRMMAAEIDMGDAEPEMIPGREKYKPRPPMPWTPVGDGDMPF